MSVTASTVLGDNVLVFHYDKMTEIIDLKRRLILVHRHRGFVPQSIDVLFLSLWWHSTTWWEMCVA